MTMVLEQVEGNKIDNARLEDDGAVHTVAALTERAVLPSATTAQLFSHPFGGSGRGGELCHRGC